MANSGKIGENLFSDIMKSRGYSVVDVSGNPEYWDKDIDFVITSPTSGLTKSFEIKWDSCIGRTGNLYLELTNIHSKGGQGWYQFCKADYLAYGDARKKQFYIIPMQELRKRVNELPYRQGKCGYDSIGQLVSLEDIRDLVEIL